MSWKRIIRRAVLRRRARRVRNERQFQELDAMLEAIRTADAYRPPWQRRDWGD